jgi:hypothetical protein
VPFWLILGSVYSYLRSREHGKPKLTRSQAPLRFRENPRNSGQRFWDDSPPRPKGRRRLRYPRQYWLRRRIARRRKKPEGEFIPWDQAYFAAHHKPHLSNPRLYYGPSFAAFCASIDPTLPIQLMKDDFLSTTKVKERAD